MTWLREPLLAARAPRHGFGTRRASEPPGLARPRQVHGAGVVGADACVGVMQPPEADAVVSSAPDRPVGVLTADCVPILLASPAGSVVAALHAGWRGLASGVVEAGVAALAQEAGAAPAQLAAAIGPHIGPCCYEVDTPVLEVLARSHGAELARASRAHGAGHAMLDLGALAAALLTRAGLPPAAVGRSAASCTCCDAQRFHSHRRDGSRAGRLVHFIAAVPRQA
jgi:YfiH family protein